MEDHHVDRPEVEAGQPAQLTGTNRSMAHLSAAFSGKYQKQMKPLSGKPILQTHLVRHIRFLPDGPGIPRGGLVGLVAIARGKTPDPIPNSAVKTLCADGTAS